MELAIKAFSLINYLSPLLWQYVMVRVVRVTLITEVVLLGSSVSPKSFNPKNRVGFSILRRRELHIFSKCPKFTLVSTKLCFVLSTNGSELSEPFPFKCCAKQL